MRKVLLILLACIAASSLCLSACFAPVQGGAGGETYGLAFNEGYLDVIELGEPIMLDEYIDPYYSNDYSLILSNEETGDEFDLKSMFQWTTTYPGTFKLTYTVNDGEFAGTTIETEIQVVVPDMSWTYTRSTMIYRAGTSILFDDLQSALNISVKSYYGYTFKVNSVKCDDNVTEFEDEISYEFPKEGTYTFSFSVITEDGQTKTGEQKVTVRPKQVLTEEGAAWLEENNYTSHDYKNITGDGSVALDAGYYTGSYTTGGNVPYLAFNGNYGTDTYVMFDFTGSNLPQLAFFCDEVTNNLGDGKNGIYIHNGLTYNDGSTFSGTDSGRITIFGPRKLSDTAGRVDNAGRFNNASNGSEANPCPASYRGLKEGNKYRYIVGFTNPTSSSLTLKILLINLTTLEREFDWTINLTTISGVSGFNWADFPLTGSIVAYGRYGVDTKWDKVYAPITGISDIHELDVAASFKSGFSKQVELNSYGNIYDYFDDADGVYSIEIYDPQGEKVVPNEQGQFKFAQSGAYRVVYDSKVEGERPSSTTVEVTFDPNVDYGDDYFEKYGAIVAGSFGTGVISQTNKDYINEGKQSLRYYLNGANTKIVVGMPASFLDFIFLSRAIDAVTFDVFTPYDMTYALEPTGNVAVAMQYEGSIAKETWTKFTITRELYKANASTYTGGWRMALAFHYTEQMEDKTAIYIDNIKLVAGEFKQEITTGGQAFLDANNITAYQYELIDDNAKVKLHEGIYQGQPHAMKNDDIPYVSYNGNYGAKSYVVFDFTGKNIPQLGFFIKETTSSLIDKKQGVIVSPGFTRQNGREYSAIDNARVTFLGPNKVEYAKYDADGRYSGQFGVPGGTAANDLEAIERTKSPMSIRGLVDGVHYRCVVGIKSATVGEVVLEFLLINLDTGAKVDYQTKKLTDTAFTTEYISGNIVLYGRYYTAITFDRIYPVYTNVTDVYAIDKVAEVLG